MHVQEEMRSKRSAKAFASAASLLAAEAAAIVDLVGRGSREALVARRAAEHARAAAASLEMLSDHVASLDEAYRAATWALNAATIALTEVRNGVSPSPVPVTTGGNVA